MVATISHSASSRRLRDRTLAQYETGARATLAPIAKTQWSEPRNLSREAHRVRCGASDCSRSLRSYDQPLARKRFVLFLDQITVALSDFQAFRRVRSKIGIALPTREESILRVESIHDHLPRFQDMLGIASYCHRQ